MRVQVYAARVPIKRRKVKCIWCHEPVLLSAANRHEGVCPLCLSESSELGWRVIYDRERGVGAIPPNLKMAYQL
jgi:hypothetical protein